MIEDGDKEPPDDTSGGDAVLLEPVDTPVQPSVPAPVEPSVAPPAESEAAATLTEPTAPPPEAPPDPSPEAGDVLPASEPTAPVEQPAPLESKAEEPPEPTATAPAETPATGAEASDQAEPGVQIEAVLPDAAPPIVAVLAPEPVPVSDAPPPASADPPPQPAAPTPEPPKPAVAPAAPPVPAVVLPGRFSGFVAFAAWRLVESVATLAVAALAIFVLLPTTTTPDWSGLGERLAVTLPLLSMSLLLAGLIGWAVGEAAVRLGGPAGAGLAAIAGLGTSLSPLVLGLVLVLVVAGMLSWLPPGGFVPWDNPVGALQSLLLPAVSLALPAGLALAGALWRAARPFSTAATFTAAAERGLGRRATLSRLVLPQAWVSVWPSVVVTLALLPPLTLVIEAAFYLPGLSRLLFGAIAARDIAGLQLALLALAGLVVFCRWLGDLLRGASNPLLTDRR